VDVPAAAPRVLRSPLLPVVLAMAVLAAGCTEPVDIKSQLQLEEVTTGWYDAGLVEGNKNKLVPTVSFRLRNKGPKQVGLLQLNAVFRRVGEDEEWGSKFIRAISGDGLAPASVTPPIVLRCDLGYTGEQPRSEMLTHSQFQDARVEVFAKHRSDDYVKLGEFSIKRQLLTQ
jgi:hypothetical protein